MVRLTYVLVVLALTILAAVCLVARCGVVAVVAVGAVIVAIGYCMLPATVYTYRRHTITHIADGGGSENTSLGQYMFGHHSIYEVEFTANGSSPPLFAKCHLKRADTATSKYYIATHPTTCALIYDLAVLTDTVAHVLEVCKTLQVPNGFRISGYMLQPAKPDSTVAPDVGVGSRPDTNASAIRMLLENMIENCRTDKHPTKYCEWYREQQTRCINEICTPDNSNKLYNCKNTLMVSDLLFRTYFGGEIFLDITHRQTIEDIQDAVYPPCSGYTRNAGQLLFSHQLDLQKHKNIILYNTNHDNGTSAAVDVPVLLWPKNFSGQSALIGYVMVGFVATIETVPTYVSIVGDTPSNSELFVHKNHAEYILYERICPNIIEIDARKSYIGHIYNQSILATPGDTTRIIKLCTQLAGDNAVYDEYTVVKLQNKLYQLCVLGTDSTAKKVNMCMQWYNRRKDYTAQWGSSPECEKNISPDVTNFVIQCSPCTGAAGCDDSTIETTLNKINEDCGTIAGLVTTMLAHYTLPVWRNQVELLFNEQYAGYAKDTDTPNPADISMTDDISIFEVFVYVISRMRAVVSTWHTRLNCNALAQTAIQFRQKIENYNSIIECVEPAVKNHLIEERRGNTRASAIERTRVAILEYISKHTSNTTTLAEKYTESIKVSAPIHTLVYNHIVGVLAALPATMRTPLNVASLATYTIIPLVGICIKATALLGNHYARIAPATANRPRQTHDQPRQNHDHPRHRRP